MTIVLTLLAAFVALGLVSIRRRRFTYVAMAALVLGYVYYAYYHG
jgi:hypothetical protein